MVEVVAQFSMTECNNALEFWKEFDLEGKRVVLEEQCVEMKDLKSASISGRKRLNELTKQFRLKSKEEQLAGLTDILKAYQDEIDQLSKRSKSSEAAFFALYKSLYDAPDPAIAIDSLIKTVGMSSGHQFEVERLKSELAQYEEEFQQLKNQDITIRRLEDQLLEFREQIEDKVAEEVEQRVTEIESQADTRIAEVREVQRAAEKRLAVAIESMKQAQASAERAQNQLFDMSSQAEKRISALLAENSLLAESMQRGQARVHELEVEVESVRTILSATQIRNHSSTSLASAGFALSAASNNEISGGSETSVLVTAGSGEEAQTLHLMIEDLRQEIRLKEDVARTDKLRLESTLRETNLQLSKERTEHSNCKKDLMARPTVEELLAVRKQLKLLQRIVFNANDEEDDEEDPTHKEDASLEYMLSTRMKLLESELSESRRALTESQQSEARNAETIATLRKSAEASAALISRLEADLEHQTTAFPSHHGNQRILPRPGYQGHGRGGAGRNASVGAGTVGSLGRSQQIGVSEGSSVELSVLLGVDMSDNKGIKPITAASGDGANDSQPGSNSMVNILQAQRDRYKERLGQVESSLLEAQQQLQVAVAAKAQLEADNVALYERIRYLQSYGSTQQKGFGGNKGPARLGPNGVILHSVDNSVMDSMRIGIPGLGVRERDILGADSGNIVGKYHEMYEQKMNPFEELEKKRKIQELSLGDRIILNTVMAIVSTTTGRSFLMVYLGTMHLLVFVVLYYNAHHVQHGCDPHLDHSH